MLPEHDSPSTQTPLHTGGAASPPADPSADGHSISERIEAVSPPSPGRQDATAPNPGLGDLPRALPARRQPASQHADASSFETRKNRGSTAQAAGGGGGAYPESVVRLIDQFAKLPGIGRRSAERLAFHVLKAKRAEAFDLARAIADVKRTVRHCGICFNLADGAPVGGASLAPVGTGTGVQNSTDIPSSGSEASHIDNAQESSDAPVLCSVCLAALQSGPLGEGRRSRDGGMVMVVEQPKDLIALEQTGMYKGVYHVLMGRISPLDGVGPGDVTIAELIRRVQHPQHNLGGRPVNEVVLALNPTLEADGTALYIAEKLAEAMRSRRGAALKVTRLARGVPTGTQLEYANKAVLADAIEGRQAVG